MRLLSEKNNNNTVNNFNFFIFAVSKTHASQINSANGFYFLPTVALF